MKSANITLIVLTWLSAFVEIRNDKVFKNLCGERLIQIIRRTLWMHNPLIFR